MPVREGLSRYAFKKKYHEAQAARMYRVIEKALKERREMKTGAAPYSDDDIFLVVRGESARLMELDRTIHHATEKPQKLLKNDGAIVTQIVESVRPAARISAKTNAAFATGTRILTLESFLSAFHQCARWHRLVLQQQLQSLRAEADRRADSDHRDGRPLLCPR